MNETNNLIYMEQEIRHAVSLGEPDIDILIKRMCVELKAKMYVYMNPAAKLQQITDVCSKAITDQCAAVCVPQWFVSTAAEVLAGSGVKTATILGLPGGTTSSAAKQAEAKQAIANGASMLIIPVNMNLYVKGMTSAAKNDLVSAAAPAKKGAEAISLIDAEKLSASEAEEVALLCIQSGSTSVLVANAAQGVMDRLKTAGIPCGSFGANAYEESILYAVPV